jgi:hypothetical protein
MERMTEGASCGLPELPWALRRHIVSFLPTEDAMTVSNIRPIGISVSTIASQRFRTVASFEKHINVGSGGSRFMFAMPIPIYAPVSTTHSVSIKFGWRYAWCSASKPKVSIVAIYKDETLPQATWANAFQRGRIVCESVATNGRGDINVASFGLRDNETYYLCFRDGRFPDLHYFMEDFFVTANIYDDRQQTLSRMYRQLRTLGIEQMEKEYGASHLLLLASCKSLSRQLCDQGGQRGTLGDQQMVQFLQQFDIPIVAASLRAVKDCILSELEVNRRHEDADRAERQAEEIRIPTGRL